MSSAQPADSSASSMAKKTLPRFVGPHRLTWTAWTSRGFIDLEQSVRPVVHGSRHGVRN
jgi:hypothetical protein